MKLKFRDVGNGWREYTMEIKDNADLKLEVLNDGKQELSLQIPFDLYHLYAIRKMIDKVLENVGEEYTQTWLEYYYSQNCVVQ